MRLSDLANDPMVAEQIPTAIGSQPAVPTMGQPGNQPTGQQLGQSSDQAENPAVAARQKQEHRRQLQDQIRQTEQQLQALRKQLAELQ